MGAVAIIPSNQERNVSSVAGYSAYNEYGGMMYVAGLLKAECQALGLRAEVFDPGSEKLDNSGTHAFVSAAVKRANAWLAANGGGVEVNIHTDSGVEFSHTFGIHTVKFPDSQRLAVTLATAAQRALGTLDLAWFDRLGTTDYNTYIFAREATYTPCLIELCSHQSTRDMAALWGKAGLLAKELAKVLAGGGASDLERRNTELAAEVARLKAKLVAIRDMAALA